MMLIGLKARLHGGKDTAFTTLTNRFGYDSAFRRVGFADKLKLSCMAALGLTQETEEATIALANRLKEVGLITVEFQDEKWSIEPHTITGREFQQWYGTEAHRGIFWDEFWVDALLPQPPKGPMSIQARSLEQDRILRSAFPDVGTLVITDCRFPNEAKRVLDLGGEVWAIDADDRLGPLPEGSHSSEWPLAPELVSRHVDNNGTLEQFEWNLIHAYDGMRGHGNVDPW